MQKKILKITSVGYAAGGAENIIVKIGPYQVDKDYSIKILASNLGPDKKHFSDYVFKSVNPANPLKLVFFLFNPSSFITLRKALKEFKPDIIHIHIMNEVTPSVLFLLKKYPTVMTLHGPEAFLSKLLIWYLQPSCFKDAIYDKKHLNLKGMLHYFYYNHLQKILYRFALKNVDIFITPSKEMQNLAKVDVSPIIHMPNFVKLREYHELKNNYNLLFVGRVEKVKGVEFLITAMPQIVKVFPQATLTIVGDGLDKPASVNQAKELRLERYIQFTGWIENKDLDAYYQKASIVVMPSIWVEAFGGVILEAMSVGRPVIGTKVGGIPEVIDDGVNGYLVEPGNADQIAEKVIKLFSDENLLKDFGRNAREHAENFSIENYVEKLDKLYDSLIEEYKTKNLLN
jgi:glycosyltransferase involved in cell wall biosynthesis